MSAPAAPHAPSLKERQRRERERLILQAAEELLVERGYHETSIDDIAARVGISKGTVYLHFGSKEDLVIALFERGMEDFVHTLDTILASPASPRARLEAILRHIYADMSSSRFQLGHMLFALMRQDPALFGRFAERRCTFPALWDEPMRRVAAVLDEGKATGEFDPEIPTPVMVRLFGSLMMPLAYQRLVLGDGMSPSEVVEHLIRFFFRGIAPSSPPSAIAPPLRRPSEDESAQAGLAAERL
jgi:AcrR family transcriptional regulator